MTPTHLSAALTLADIRPASRTATAVRLVLLDGLSQREASRQAGVDVAAVSRALKRIEPYLHVTHCPTCGKRL